MKDLLEKLREVYRKYHSVANLDRKVDSYSSQLVGFIEKRQELLDGVEDEVLVLIEEIESAVKESPEDRDKKAVKIMLEVILKEQDRIKMRQEDN
jgi:hypothetical protein